RAAHATSSGKVLLAFGTPADVERVLGAGLPRLGPRTITSPAVFEQALEEVRTRGYAASVEESAKGVASVAAPVLDGAGERVAAPVLAGAGEWVAAMSVAGPVTRMGADRLDHFARLVLAAAASIPRSTQLGGAA